VRSGVRDADLVAFRQSVERDIALGAASGAAAAAARLGDAATLGVPGLSGGGVTATGVPTQPPGTPTPPTPRKP
jgi:hypothetical protein